MAVSMIAPGNRGIDQANGNESLNKLADVSILDGCNGFSSDGSNPFFIPLGPGIH